MLYSIKYPKAKALEEVEANIIYWTKRCPCIYCARLTSFIEINYQRHVCSDECLRKFEQNI